MLEGWSTHPPPLSTRLQWKPSISPSRPYLQMASLTPEQRQHSRRSDVRSAIDYDGRTPFGIARRARLRPLLQVNTLPPRLPLCLPAPPLLVVALLHLASRLAHSSGRCCSRTPPRGSSTCSPSSSCGSEAIPSPSGMAPPLTWVWICVDLSEAFPSSILMQMLNPLTDWGAYLRFRQRTGRGTGGAVPKLSKIAGKVRLSTAGLGTGYGGGHTFSFYSRPPLTCPQWRSRTVWHHLNFPLFFVYPRVPPGCSQGAHPAGAV